MDRAEWTGTGAALLFHVALIGAMSMSLAHVAKVPEPPAMEVEFADEIALQSAAPATVATPPPAAQAPELGPPDPVEAPPPSPPLPSPTPAPAAKPTPQARPQQAKPTQARPQQAARGPRLGSDFLKGIGDDLAPKSATGKPAAATVSASAMAGIASAIRRQVQPCADRQVNPGPGASRIRVKMRLQLFPNGRMKRPPLILGTSGVDGDNEQYEERVKDLAVAAFVGCAPLRGLPPELYETASGAGWSDFIMNYNLPN